MRIGVQAWGSDGDIRPLLALAGGLRSAGHDVAIAVTSTENRDYGTLCQGLGLTYIKVPEHVGCDMRSLGEKFDRSPNRVESLKLFIHEIYLPYLGDMFSAAKMLCVSNDLVVGHFAVFPLKAAATMSGTPYVSVILFRGSVPSLFQPPGRMPNLGPLGNFIEWKLVQAVFDFFFRREVKRLWVRRGMAAPRHVLPDAWESDRLNLIAASRVFCPPQPDWGRKYQVCGYFWLPEKVQSWTISSGLQDFLDAGKAPVYMTFGLLQPLYPEKYVELMVKTARLACCRAIIQTTSSKYPPGSGHDDIYFIDRVPHHRIFPRCAAVAYHGGGGTAHSVTRCGLPSVVVGFSSEHMSYGKDLFRLGAGSKPVRYRKVTAEKLAARIRHVLDAPQIRRRSLELGEIMRQEDGVGRAVKLINNLDRG